LQEVVVAVRICSRTTTCKKKLISKICGGFGFANLPKIKHIKFQKNNKKNARKREGGWWWVGKRLLFFISTEQGKGERKGSK
jgi:hypothetical protein